MKHCASQRRHEMLAGCPPCNVLRPAAAPHKLAGVTVTKAVFPAAQLPEIETVRAALLFVLAPEHLQKIHKYTFIFEFIHIIPLLKFR